MTTNDIDWLAFAYLHDELPSAEREAFERLLADDQPARESLARAVELSQAIVAAETLSVTLAPASRKRPAAGRFALWAAVTAASLLAVAVGLIGTFGWPGLRQDNAELAAAWSDAQPEWESRAVDASFSVEQEGADQDAESESFASISDWSSAEIETPSWMTAAVLAQDESAESVDDTPASADAPSATES